MVYGMVIKMRRYDITVRVIRRMLYRRESIDVLALRENYDTARMLSRRPAHPRTSF